MSYERHPLEMDPNIERCPDCGNAREYCDCPDAEQQREFRKRLDDLEAKVDAAKAKRAQVTTREEAAAHAICEWDQQYQWGSLGDESPMKALYEFGATEVLAAADAHDLAHGVHRIVLDDATVERAADILLQGDLNVCECRRSPFDKHDVNPPCSTRKAAVEKMRRVLAAAVQEER